jgi:hypothetical protein
MMSQDMIDRGHIDTAKVSSAAHRRGRRARPPSKAGVTDIDPDCVYVAVSRRIATRSIGKAKELLSPWRWDKRLMGLSTP